MKKNMGSAYVVFIVIIMLISLESMHVILMADASWNAAQSFAAQRPKELFFMEDAGDSGGENGIGEVSGEDGNGEDEAPVFDKFRDLLGLKTPHKIDPSDGAMEYGSPSPSPSLSPTPSPSPSPNTIEALSPPPKWPIHVHSRHRSPRSTAAPPPYKLYDHHGEKGRRKITLVAALLTLGATLLICGFGIFWAGQKYYNHRKRISRTGYRSGNGGGSRERFKRSTSENSANKVRHDPGFDLFYLETLTTVLEPQACVKETPNFLSTSSIENPSSFTVHEVEDLDHDPEKLGTRITNSSSNEEIVSVHEYPESIKYESEVHNSSVGDRIASIHSDSSDDESFHSLCDSHSSHVRLSNASLDSLGDTAKDFSPKQSRNSPSSTTNPSMAPLENPPNRKEPTKNVPESLNCHADLKNHPPPPPPPPSPPPLRSNNSPSPLPSSRVTVAKSKSFFSTTLPNGLLSTPRAPSSIPPPPCPPPPLRIANGSSISGPPPPPVQPPGFKSPGKDGGSLPKLKPLHWDKVRAAPDRSTVWDKLRSSSFELDEEMIGSLFGYNLQKSAFGIDEGKSKTPSPSKHVLEPKRLQNLTILSKALNVTTDQVCNALLEGDGLSMQQLEALAKMEPTKEEEEKLFNYKGDINELGSAEKLVGAVLHVPFGFQRIDAMLYRATFEDEVVHLTNSFSMLQDACRELRSSRLFLKLLEAVLKTGNRMNVGTIRGGARAFKLDALLKLADVKGTDGKTTLLHFVVKEIVRSEGMRMSESIIGKINQINKNRTAEEKEEDYRRMGLELVSGLGTELCNVKKTASIDMDVLASSVSNLSDGMSKLQQLVRRDLSDDVAAAASASRNFAGGMKSFVSHGEKKLKELQGLEERVLLSVREITEYFHGDVGRDEGNPLWIFVIVRDFLGTLDQVCRELKSLKTPRSPSPLSPFH